MSSLNGASAVGAVLMGVGIGITGFGLRAPRASQTLILDMNNVLVYRKWSPDWVDPAADARVKQFNVYVRPGAKEFVKRMQSQWVNVGVWTSGMEHNVQPIIPLVFIEQPPTFTMYQPYCTKYPPRNGSDHALLVKDLRNARLGGENDCTVIVENDVDKILMRQWSSAVIVKPWERYYGEEDEATSFEQIEKLIYEHPIKRFTRNAAKKLMR